MTRITLTFNNNHATSRDIYELMLSSTGASYEHEDADDQGMTDYPCIPEECNEITRAMPDIHHVQLLLQRHGRIPLALTMK